MFAKSYLFAEPIAVFSGTLRQDQQADIGKYF
jgi:hypothetical protein